MQNNTSTEMLAPQENRKQALSVLRSTFLRALELLIFRADVGSPLLELPILQVKCLNRIVRSEGQPMGEIARQMDIELPGLSRIIDRLARRGLVERVSDAHNRRITRLYLTEAGKALMDEAEKTRLAHFYRCIESLDMEALGEIIGALDRLATAAETATQPASKADMGAKIADDPVIHLIARYPRTRRGRLHEPPSA